MKLIFVFFVGLFFLSCQKEVVMINSTSVEKPILVSSLSEKPQIYQISLATGEIISENFFNNSDLDELKSIDKIYINSENISDDNYYIVSKKSMKIVVINKFDDSTIAIYDFGEKQLIPSSIAFPNSSNIYVVHENSNKLTVIDVYNQKFGREIEVGEMPVSTLTISNRIYISNKKDRSISVVSTKLKSETNEFSLKNKPEGSDKYESFIPVDIVKSNKEDEIIVLTTGEKEGNKSKANLLFINRNGGEFNRLVDIDINGLSTYEINSNRILTTNSGWLFLATENRLLRMNLNSISPLQELKNYSIQDFYHTNDEENRIILAENIGENSNLMTISIGGVIVKRVRLNFNINTIFPL